MTLLSQYCRIPAMISDDALTFLTLKYGKPTIFDGYDLQSTMRDGKCIEYIISPVKAEDGYEYELGATYNVYCDSHEFNEHGNPHYIDHEYYSDQRVLVLVIEHCSVIDPFTECSVIHNVDQLTYDIMKPLLKRTPTQ